MADELTMAAVVDAIIEAGLRNNDGGDCERHRLCAEPCAGCPYCDAEGNI